MSDTDIPERARARAALTPPQLEILGLVAAGLSTRDIAARLGIAQGTVKAHLTMIYSRLGVTNRVQATRHYLEHLPPG